MRLFSTIPRVLFSVLLMAAQAGMAAENAGEQASLAAVGRAIFLDTGLSNPPGVGCASCHVPEAAFADPRPVSPGAIAGSLGRRNAPSLMYAALIPNMDQEDMLREDGTQDWVWQGGLFQDGSARTLHEQVQRPFFEHAEMNVGGEAELAAKLRKSGYAQGLKSAMKDEEWSDDAKLAKRGYRALVEFLKEPVFRPFDARIDDYLAGDKQALTEQEQRGLVVFKERGKCADCHFLQATSWPRPLLSDFGYDNLGAPSRGEKDPGLGGHTLADEEVGQFRAPSLRNVALTAPYFHNGSIATLREVMEFYNRRDQEPERWGKTDYPETVNHSDLGNLGLTDAELTDLTALMEAFTDRSLLQMRERGEPFPAVVPGTPDSWKMRSYFPDWNYAAPVLPPNPPYQGKWLKTKLSVRGTGSDSDDAAVNPPVPNNVTPPWDRRGTARLGRSGEPTIKARLTDGPLGAPDFSRLGRSGKPTHMFHLAPLIPSTMTSVLDSFTRPSKPGGATAVPGGLSAVGGTGVARITNHPALHSYLIHPIHPGPFFSTSR